ncbi:MAG: hypothetical protein R2795_18555 [Saprospiraceae bacterium]
MPLLYANGAPYTQAKIKALYQWEVADSPGGPWMEIEGATTQNYTPSPATSDRYFRRISRNSDCCGNTLISTSSVAAVLGKF